MSFESPYRAPDVDMSAPAMAAEPLTWQGLLFSFEERIPRRLYWAANTRVVLVILVVVLLVELSLGTESGLGAGLLLLLYVSLLWVSFAVQVKRWQDRDKFGWWSLIGFLPIIGAASQFVENGCLRRTKGPNRFGADPT